MAIGGISEGKRMATFGKKAASKVEVAMHERKVGTLKSGSTGKKVTSKKQAIAIGLSEARKEGDKVPAKKTAANQPATRTPASKKAPARTATAKSLSIKSPAKRTNGKSKPAKQVATRKTSTTNTVAKKESDNLSVRNSAITAQLAARQAGSEDRRAS